MSTARAGVPWSPASPSVLSPPPARRNRSAVFGVVVIDTVVQSVELVELEVLDNAERVALGVELNVQAQPHASKMTPGVGSR